MRPAPRPVPARALLLGAPAALAALLAVQGWRTASATYLPPPDYDVALRVGAGEGGPVRLAVLGDSTVHGIGAVTPEGSLSGLVAERLVATLGRPVVVTAFGRSGARTADVADLATGLGEHPCDVVLVVVGSNDATHGMPPWRMRAETRSMLGSVAVAAGGAPVVLGGIPEFHTVPAVPRPLRWVLGAHADLLRGRQAAGAADAGVAFVDIRALASPLFLERPESMSVDGFHPSEVGYAIWADVLAPALAEALGRSQAGAVRRS